MCLGFPITQISTPVETLTWKAGSFCLCCFWQVVRHLWSLYVSGIHRHADLCSNSMSTQPASLYCLYCFWQAGGRLWSLNVSGIPHHTYLNPSRNVSPMSWFILSVLFLTGGETSVVPTHVKDSHHMDLYPGRNVYSSSRFILSVLFLTGGETSVVPTRVPDTPSHRCLLQ